jgi:four helix bundle protein
MQIFQHSKKFPIEERYSLTDQIRRSSRSVNANISEAWRKRRYPAAFVSKLSDAETEAGETQSWLEFAVSCRYLDRAEGSRINYEYEQIIGMMVTMMTRPERWAL